MSQISLEHTVRNFWVTRPCRRADDRKIAGVAAAISRRYAIDPVLVRVAFVVSTLFNGVGLLLYLLGWLLLPVEADPDRTGARALRARRGLMSAVLTIALVLLLIRVTEAVLGGRPSGVLALGVAMGALVLLHHSRAALGEIAGSPPAVVRSEQAPANGSGRTTPPAWDPLGVAPFAWDLPEPPTPAPTTAPRGARSKVTPITLGLALLTGGMVVVLWPALSAAQIAALMLGVVGLGLVLGSFLQGGRGLILAAIPLALFTWVFQAAPASDFKIGGSHWDPITAAQVQPRYAVTLGNGRLDLTGLRLAAGQTVRTSVTVGLGETHVILPPNVDAQVSCQTQIGGVDCLGHTGYGHPSRASAAEPGSASPHSGKIILDVHSGVGHVHVERGS